MGYLYQFHVEGHLDQTWSAWLGTAPMRHRSDGTTTFIHAIADRAALCGVLLRLCNTGVGLIAARRVTGSEWPAPVPASQKEQQVAQEIATDELAIRALVAEVEAGWNAGDGERFAAPFAEDADYVVVDGRYIKGRQIIAEGHSHIFATIYRGSHNAANVLNIRLLRPDVALAHVEWQLRFSSDGAAKHNTAVTTLVLTRSDEAWSIAAFQNTLVQRRGG